MPRVHSSIATLSGVRAARAGYDLLGRHLHCSHCEHPLECLDKNRRSGTWLGSFMCPNCRSEYFYAYRWGRLVQKA
jgi:hypothetical protein